MTFDAGGRAVTPPIATLDSTPHAAHVQTVYLHPGRIHVGRESTRITTILGSCVTVCLWDRRQHIGGANHFLLPFDPAGAAPSTRYGESAMRLLVEECRAAGARLANLEAKVFGGACVLDALRDQRRHLGQRNVELATNYLDAAGIPIVARDVEGRRGRKLVFSTHDGSAWVRSL